MAYYCKYVATTVDARPSFGTPVFVNPEIDGLFVQRPQQNADKIAGFDIVDDDTDELVSAPGNKAADIGDQLLYAFLLRDGTIFVGSKDQISNKLSTSINNDLVPIGFRVQAAEIMGDRELSRKFRRKIGIDTGPQSADISRTYHRSYAQTLLWNCLFDSAKDKEAIDRLFPKLSLATVEVENDGSVTINLDGVDLIDFPTFDVAKASAAIEIELGISVPSNDDTIESGVHDQLFDIFSELSVDNVRSFVNERLGKDARVSSGSYYRALDLIKKLGFRDLNEVATAIGDYNTRALAYYAWGTPQGPITRLELALLAALGEQFNVKIPYWTGTGYPVLRNTLLDRFREKGVTTGSYDIDIHMRK